LALALAESVQSLNKNDKTSFLLMKVLGPKILKVSLSFLKRCNHKENRIVGIISHVELQERIPVPSMCLKTKKRKWRIGTRLKLAGTKNSSKSKALGSLRRKWNGGMD
jgi:hypothetical protein